MKYEVLVIFQYEDEVSEVIKINHRERPSKMIFQMQIGLDSTIASIFFGAIQLKHTQN